LTVIAAGTATSATATADVLDDIRGGRFQINATAAGGSVIGRQYGLDAEL
jgi:hypothetical protein